MFQNLQAVLFDLDGTLIDSAPDLGAAADKMRTDRGLAAYPLERYRPMAGAGARGMLEIAFGIAPGHATFDSLREEFFKNYENCLTQRTAAFDGIPEVIAHILHRGLKWGVVTNKAERFALPITKGMPLFSTASTIVGVTPHPMPSRTQHQCTKPPSVLGWIPHVVCMLATTCATFWQAKPRAWPLWRPVMAI